MEQDPKRQDFKEQDKDKIKSIRIEQDPKR